MWNSRVFRSTKKIAPSEKRPKSGLLLTKGSKEFNSQDWRNSILEHQLSSEEIIGDSSCEIEFVNCLDNPFVLCWINESGQLYHFYRVNDNSIVDGSVSNSHVEFTVVNDSFVCFTTPTGDMPKFASQISNEDFLLFYKSKRGASRHIVKLHKGSNGGVLCDVDCIAIEADSIIDTSDKEYIVETLCGFQVYCEPGVFEKNSKLLELLTDDLICLNRLIPTSILHKLQRDTHIWLNHEITFGTTKAPVIGSTCTYHSCHGADWLRRNGMSESKAGSVEIYCASEYLRTRCHWGAGGVLLHEYAHSVHDKYCANGFDNDDVQGAYRAAMERKLYDAVEVHG